jgi:hypothetical protein
MLNSDLIKEVTFEDYNRRLNHIISKMNEIYDHDKSGLFIRILNFDRGWLFGCFSEVLNVSQTSNIGNRDELSFFESLIHLFNYDIYDDGGVCVKYHKYDLNEGILKECPYGTKGSKPFVRYASCGDRIAKENDLLKVLDEIERIESKRIKNIEAFGFDDEPKYKRDYINYISND